MLVLYSSHSTNYTTLRVKPEFRTLDFSLMKFRGTGESGAFASVFGTTLQPAAEDDTLLLQIVRLPIPLKGISLCAPAALM
jgi:hypothetical protein